jgi:hypothetical protein
VLVFCTLFLVLKERFLVIGGVEKGGVGINFLGF